MLPLQMPGKGLFQASLLASGTSLACGDTTLVFAGILPVHMSVSASPLRVRTAIMLGQGAALLQYDLILANYIYNDPISKKGHIRR